MHAHSTVSSPEWLAARQALLEREKAFTKARDELSRARRELPWERIDKPYVFDAAEGEVSLSDLFAGRSQLLVYHFMFGPEAKVGCKSCSFWADNIERNVIHLAHRDVSFVAISRGQLANLLAFQQRMGWSFRWVSSARTEFNFDFQVSFDSTRTEDTYNYAKKTFGGSELPGISVFAKNEAGEVFHTYSTYGRGLDMVNAGYHLLDLVPKGRDEEGLPSPMAWLRHRDNYGDAK